MKSIVMTITATMMLAFPVAAQDQIEAKVDMSFNVLRDFEELSDGFKKLAEAHPELCSLTSLGASSQGRDIWMLTINNPVTGEDIDKPAMWIDGNVHGNEVQAGDVVLYTAW